MIAAAQPFSIRHLNLRNRIVGAPHGRGLLADGLALPADGAYWRRLAAGGAAMLTVGGTVTAAESTWRRRIVTEAWREDAVEGLALRAQAIRSEGAVAACQLVHLGRESTGAEMWYPTVAPSAVRSPREPTRPRAVSETEIDTIVEGFRRSAVHACQAGFQVVELHAAHGYLLAQFLSPSTNRRPDADNLAGRMETIARIASAIRACTPEVVLGIRLSSDGEDEGGFTVAQLCALLPAITPLVDYVSLTVGVRSTYVRDMATTEPPLLREVDQLRAAVDRPLLVSQAFRRAESIEAALRAGADLVGVARPLIADPDFPAKLLAGRARDVRPCVSCNEDCRAFDPVLLCSVNPDLGPAASGGRPASPLTISRTPHRVARRIAIVGAGPAGLECAISIPPDRDVVLFEEADRIGGQLAIAATAPNRSGWQALIDFYTHRLATRDNVELRLGAPCSADVLAAFDHLVVAVGSIEVLPELPGVDRALSASRFIAEPPVTPSGSDLLIVDDGFGWWPCASAVETAVAGGWKNITVVTRAASFGARLPPEGHVQLMARLRGAPLQIQPLTAVDAVDTSSVLARNVLSGTLTEMPADTVVLVGERRARAWDHLPSEAMTVQVIGDAVVPRRVQHALAEGRAAAGHGTFTAG
jgi:2,4-dienoyl-CoA reductase (NADPH2)